MEEKYIPKAVEAKWQQKWDENNAFQAEDFSAKPKKYILVEFPYPSGDGLHVGHCRSYTALDVIARKSRMEGDNVLFPMGWDAFGLPTENYAIKTGVHPREATQKNTDNFRRQMKALGFSFDWSREINTTDPSYYRWTQWIFIQLFNAGLAYKKKMPINWCPACRIGLANEEVLDGTCERCGAPVEQRQVEQWMLKITAYADKLLAGLDEVDFPARVKEQQKNWIGRKEGINITYPIDKNDKSITCFTTRPDTNFGATFVVLAPEHDFSQEVSKENEDIANYIEQATKKTERERVEEEKIKTGVFTGYYAVNRLTEEKIPIWVSDFVLGHYGTGAVVGVPGHDKRDFEFAAKFDLPVKRVITGSENDTSDIRKVEQVQEEEGTLINSGFLDGLDTKKAQQKIMDFLEDKGWGEKNVTYSLRDWVFSRQHYWGEPIPVIHCEKCGMVPEKEENLPVTLPQVENYQPTNNSESPLANITEWVNTTCPACGGQATRETDTMPNWAGSSWYFLRYTDPSNDKHFADQKLTEYWLPVDIYNGGMEHTTLHLLYSRFWNQFLYDQGFVPYGEPYKKRTSHGMVLGEGGVKMSKSRGNVVTPDGIVNIYGADTLRLYEMFIGPFSDTAVWNTNSLIGSHRFLNRVWSFVTGIKKEEQSDELEALTHETIKKVTESIERFSFNTAISSLMEMLNELEKKGQASVSTIEAYLLLLHPFAPHITEELWEKSGHENPISEENWPEYNQEILRQRNIKLPVQINGKVRGEIILRPDSNQEEAQEAAKQIDNVNKHLQQGETVKVIYIPGKMLNFVIKH